MIIGPRLGFSTREALALAALLNTRGLVELVVLNIGLEAGLLPLPLFAMLVLMALGTTAMTSPLLRWLGYPSDVSTGASIRSVRALAEILNPGPRELWSLCLCVR